MANIQISKLNPSGSELFSDSESYLNELSEQELTNTTGGGTPFALFATKLTVKVTKKVIVSAAKYIVEQRRG